MFNRDAGAANDYGNNHRLQSEDIENGSSVNMSPSPFEQNDSLMIIHADTRQHAEEAIDNLGAGLFGGYGSVTQGQRSGETQPRNGNQRRQNNLSNAET